MAFSIFNKQRKSKKSNAILDSLMTVVVLLVIAVSTVMVWNVWKDLSPSLYEEVSGNAEATASLDVVENKYTSVMDGAFLFIFIGLWLTTLVASWMIDTHPIFFVVSLILFVFVLGLSVYIGNFYEEFITSEDMNETYQYFPATHYIMTNLLIVTIIIGASIMIVLYGKSRQ